MREILDHFHLNGLSPNDLTLDGKVHRFKLDSKDHKNSGWYIGFQNYANSNGGMFHVVRYGNYQTGDVYQYQTDREYTPMDKRAVMTAIAKAKKEAEDARIKVQEETSKECQEKWEALPTLGPCGDYLSSKGLTRLYGSRSFIDLYGVCLFVPMRDVEGKIWSLQKIQANGGKFFYPGGRVQGCFHTIGDGLEGVETVYIAEGFATAASIHEAIGRPVVCAFNSGNLIEVARQLRRKYPDKAFVICGDEDKWKDPTRNPGREAAEEAAKITLGIATFPKFKDETTKPTDFNDLHQFEGVDAVKEQILPLKTEASYIIALGYDAGDYFLLSNANPQIQRLTASQLNSSGLCRVQPLTYWEAFYQGKNESVSWTRAADQIMQDCHRKGIFRPDRIRGRGVWCDTNRVVYHRGTNLWIDGKEFPLHRSGLNTRYIYELSDMMPPVHPLPLTTEECQNLLDAAISIRWKKKESFMFYAGWLATAPLGAALFWRPHLWITGPSGSGKSYVMQEITYPILRNHCQYFRGQTTEAGIRQKCGSSTLPVLFDEFETNDEHSGSRIRSVLELARQASSDSDGVVAKGTVTGEAIEFRPQFSMCVGSVRLNLVHEEDENRFTVLELERSAQSGGQAQFDNLRKFVNRLGEDFGDRLFARMLKLAMPLRASTKTFQRVICERYPMRVGQQYGTLLAGFWMLQNDAEVTEDQARSLCHSIDFSVARESADRSDEMECLDYLLQKTIPLSTKDGRQDFPIQEMILENASIDLQRIGINLDSDFIYISCNHRAIASFYGNSRWNANYDKQLMRIDGAEKKQKKFPTLGQNLRCVVIPRHKVFR